VLSRRGDELIDSLGECHREAVLVRNRRGSGIGRRLVVGALSGAVGTAAMDLLLYRRYRREGGKDSAWRWESAEGVTSWDTASPPGQLGE
jgi:hypothetical protein